jgi:hypothetical protein
LNVNDWFLFHEQFCGGPLPHIYPASGQSVPILEVPDIGAAVQIADTGKQFGFNVTAVVPGEISISLFTLRGKDNA